MKYNILSILQLQQKSNKEKTTYEWNFLQINLSSFMECSMKYATLQVFAYLYLKKCTFNQETSCTSFSAQKS